MDNPVPRINSSQISQNIGSHVTIVGKVVQFNGSQCILEASDHGNVNVHLNESASLASPFMEIIGLVNPDGSIQAISTHSMGDKFDLDTYEHFLSAANSYPKLFV